MTETSVPKRPRLPRPFSLPLGLVPGKMHNWVMAKILTQVFAVDLRDGELDFMQGRTVRIGVDDLGVAYTLGLQGRRFIAVPNREPAQLTIGGTLYDYLLLVSGREDPDTLFFQRHLRLEGDTDLGVHLKNFLAGVDMESLPIPLSIKPALDRGLALYERLA